MSTRTLVRRLQTLETPAPADTTHDGYAPMAWTQLAEWALVFLDTDDDTPLPDDISPYNRIGNLWLITHFWQRGVDRFLNSTNADTSLAVILACVDEFQRQGMPHKLIKDWRTGRQVWYQAWAACHPDMVGYTIDSEDIDDAALHEQ